jgi:hypothetical protein
MSEPEGTGPVEVWVANQGANFTLDGLEYTIVPGTTFRNGHPAVAAHPELFKAFVPDYDWAAPRSGVKAQDRGARSR